MSVYVDDMRAPYRGMLMSHMLADTTEELLSMADSIGVQRRWIQKRGTEHEHFDVCEAKRTIAIQMGAIPVGMHDMVGIIQRKRAALRATPRTERPE